MRVATIDWVLQLPQLLRIFRGQISCLREVLLYIVEFPWRFVRIRSPCVGSHRDEGGRRGHPANMIKTEVAAEFEVLRLAQALGVRVLEGGGEAQDFDRLLLHAVQV